MGPRDNLHNRIDLVNVPFTERGSRLMLFQRGQTLHIRLAERWIKQEKSMGHYRQRQPIIDQFTIVDAEGQAGPITVDTYPDAIHVLTPVGQFDWAFIDPESLLLRLPSGRWGLEFITLCDRGAVDRRGGTMHGVRNISYTTNARLIRNEITSIDDNHLRVSLQVEAQPGDVLLLNITPRLGYNRSLPDVETAFAEARRRWDEWFAAAPDVLEQYRPQFDYAMWIMRASLMSTRYFFTREACTPSKIHYVGVWHWDQFFHALAYRHLDARLAEDQIRILIDHQQPNGMLPDAIHDEGLITHLAAPVDADVTKPPLMAWTAMKLYETSGRRDFLEEIYEPLIKWNQWWMTENVDEHGLGMYRHPFSSGLDDSPLWDEGMPVTAPDLNAYLVMQHESLGRIADILGEADAADGFRRDAQRLREKMLAVLWDDDRGLFNALHDGKPVPALTPFSLLPLWMNSLPTRINQRLIANLTDPRTFWSQWPLPTVALNDPKFDPLQMWRGPTWVNINYLFIEGLERAGRPDLAGQLRRKTLDLILRQPDIYEYYNPITGDRPPKAAPIFGWTSAIFIDLAIQETAAARQSK